MNVTKASLKVLTRLKWCSFQQWTDTLKKLAISKTLLLIPRLDHTAFLRDKVVTSSEKIILNSLLTNYEKVTHNNYSYWFGLEPYDLHHKACFGTMVSCWGKHPLVTKIELSYEFAQAALGVYGLGYGNRLTTACGGLNMYFKERGRDDWRPHPTPMVATNEVGLHQYFNNRQKNDLYNAMIRRCIHEMAHNVLVCGKIANEPLMQLVGNICDRLILTTGHLPCRGKNKKLPDMLERTPLDPPHSRVWSKTPTFGFVNTSHVDHMDSLTKEQRQEWKMASEQNGWTFCKTLLSSPDFCLPTTCGYQFCFSSEEVTQQLSIMAFFSMEGLGLAVQLEHGIFHHFMPAMFSHRTCLPVCKIGTSSSTMLSCCNSDNTFLIVGWGNSGGKKEVRASNKTSSNEAPPTAAKKKRLSKQQKKRKYLNI